MDRERLFAIRLGEIAIRFEREFFSWLGAMGIALVFVLLTVPGVITLLALSTPFGMSMFQRASARLGRAR